jgi:signal peptidase II
MLLSRPVHLIIVSAGVVGLDQLVKVLVTSRLGLFEVIVVIPGLFNLTYIRNPGAAFGLLGDIDPNLGLLIFGGATALAAVALGYLYFATSGELAWTRERWATL